jgi:general secretion pathway protein A
MYLEYYHLAQKPFQINTDPAFLWYNEKHKEALATLKYGLLENKSFLLLTGDVGVGKTTIINALLQVLDKNEMVAVINDPKLEKLDFFLHIARAFGMSGEFTTKGQFLLAFRELLLEQHYRGKQLLLIVDECQLLNHDLLEEIRLFSNLEQNGAKLINIFFVGQLEFNDILLLPENKAIKQRITVTYNLPPLSMEETGQYIEHRLTVAGATRKIFEKNAFPEIFAFSKGYPRLINVICDRALLTGFIGSSRQIDKKIIQECITELDISSATKARQELEDIGQRQSPTASPNQSSKSRGILLAVIILILLAAALYHFFGPLLTVHAPASAPEQTIAPGTPPKEQTKIMLQPLNTTPDGTSKTATPPPPKETNNTEPLLESHPAPPPPEKEEPALGNSPAPEDITRQDPIPEPEPPVKTLTITFALDALDINEASLMELETLAKAVLRQKTSKVIVHGYTDASGSAQYNTKLAGFRATAVKNILMGKGIAAERISSVSHISTQNDTTQNQGIRRVEVEVVKE